MINEYDSQSYLSAIGGTAYIVDSEYKINSIGHEGWNSFATTNGAPELTFEENIVGTSIFDFITGDKIKEFYKQIFSDLLSERKRSASVIINCDGPTVQRNIHLSISLLSMTNTSPYYLFQAIGVSENMRPPIDFLDKKLVHKALAALKDVPILAICSFCNLVRYPVNSNEKTGNWITGAEYYQKGGETGVKLSHTICPHCYDEH